MTNDAHTKQISYSYVLASMNISPHAYIELYPTGTTQRFQNAIVSIYVGKHRMATIQLPVHTIELHDENGPTDLEFFKRYLHELVELFQISKTRLDATRAKTIYYDDGRVAYFKLVYNFGLQAFQMMLRDILTSSDGINFGSSRLEEKFNQGTKIH